MRPAVTPSGSEEGPGAGAAPRCRAVATQPTREARLRSGFFLISRVGQGSPCPFPLGIVSGISLGLQPLGGMK